MKRLILLLILCPLIVVGQQTITGENILSIKNFGGLNTRSGDFSIKQNEFRQLDGVDLNLNLGSITKRWGYDNQGTVTGQDSLIGIFGAYFSDGRQRLVYVGDSAGVKYGNIYVTGFNVVSGQTRIATEWPIINKPNFEVFKNDIYITNGSSRGIVYDGRDARPFPNYNPGEPKIIPLKVTANGDLNGEYIYLFAARETEGQPFTAGAIDIATGEPSRPVRVKNGQILLKDFTWITGHIDAPEPDSIWIRIYRTKANPGNLDTQDSAFWVGTDIIATSAANLATKSFIDSVADGSLVTDSAMPVYKVVFDGYGVTGSTYPPYGAPMLVDTSEAFAADSGFWGGLDGIIAWGYAYAYTILDTASLLESDLSPPLFFRQTSPATIDSLVIGIPSPPSERTGYRINLYRQLIVSRSWDTTWQNIDPTNLWNLPTNCVVDYENGGVKCRSALQARFDPGYIRDSVYGDNLFLIGQIDEADSMFFVDTLRHDSVAFSFQNLYDPTSPLSPMDGIEALEDRLFGFLGSTVAFSRLDNESRWFIFDKATVNAQDGQRISAIWGQRDALRIGKTQSLHNFYQTADTLWNLSEITHHIGVVAPHSVAQGLGGTYYYTDFGVMRETEGQFRDRQFSIENISVKIAALDSIPVAIKESAVGFYYKQMYMLSLPYDSTAGDSGLTYVYFEKAKAWARWPNLSFGGATLYSTETELSFLPPDTMYFFKAGQSVIYRFADFEKDNTDGTPFPIQIRATSAPLFTDDMNLYKRVNRVGIIAGTTTRDTLIVQFQDEEGNQKSPDIEFLDLRTKYQVSATSDSTTGRYLQYILTNLSGSWATNTKIEGIELFYQLEGQNDDN